MTSKVQQGYDPAVEPMQPDRSLGELVGDMTNELGRLMRAEIELAKTEAKDELGRFERAATMFAVAGLAGLMTAVMLSFALAWLLDQAMNTALAFTLVGLVWAAAGAALFSAARKRAKQIEVVPETKQTLKEDVQWARQQRN